MEGFTGIACSIESPVGHEIGIVQLPVHIGPGRVEHPLYHTHGFGFVNLKSFKHRAHELIIEHLGLKGKVLHPFGCAVSLLHGGYKPVKGTESFFSTMIFPHFIHRPKMFRGNHLFDAFQGRHIGSRTGLRIKAVGSSEILIRVPVYRRSIGIRSQHFHSG